MGVVRQIARAFEDEGLAEDPDEDRRWYDGGDRRGTFDRHVAQVDWTDAAQVRQVLGAFSTIMTWGDGEYADGEREKLRKLLARDGFTVDDDGSIRPSTAMSLGSIPLENLADPSAILEHLERLAEATDRDPATAISGAKALVEATTKVVLREMGVNFDEKATVPALVREAQKALKLHPDTLAPTAPGVEIVTRLLSNLSQVAIGLAELRNQYGPDHGRSTAVVGLGPRHGHLAVGAATTYCRLLIETLDARRSANRPSPAP
jgi:hypothetical protein